MPDNATRLYAILAREAPTAVIFRRGPSRQVQLIKWDLRTDRLEHGQWLKGRIYERRCDLSPSGKYLIYFAANYRGAPGTWTAISRPPYLTALAFWPKGDAWGGGGAFESETKVMVNHDAGSFRMDQLPAKLTAGPFGAYSGGGEDYPIKHHLLTRDGWVLADQGEGSYQPSAAPSLFEFSRPETYEKRAPNGRRLRMMLRAVGRVGAAWYKIDYQVLTPEDEVLVDLPSTDWADWDGNDLLFGRDGRLWRLNKGNARRYAQFGEAALKLIYDFREARFEAIPPSPRHSTW